MWSETFTDSYGWRWTFRRQEGWSTVQLLATPPEAERESLEPFSYGFQPEDIDGLKVILEAARGHLAGEAAGIACSPDESAGVREELEEGRRPDMSHYGRDVLLAVLASGLPDWQDSTVSRALMLAAAREELVRRYPCQDCGAPAGSECLPEYGCHARSRRNPNPVELELEETRAGRSSRD